MHNECPGALEWAFSGYATCTQQSARRVALCQSKDLSPCYGAADLESERPGEQYGVAPGRKSFWNNLLWDRNLLHLMTL